MNDGPYFNDDVFSFLPVPTLRDHVNDTFCQLGIKPARVHTLSAFLMRALSGAPEHHASHERPAALERAKDVIALALEAPRPFFANRSRVSEAFLCAAVKPYVAPGFATIGLALRASDLPDQQVVIDGNAILIESETLLAMTPPSSHSYGAIMPASRLMVQMRAVMMARDILRGAKDPAFLHGSGQSLHGLFERINSLKPILMRQDSDMARRALATLALVPPAVAQNPVMQPAGPARGQVIAFPGPLTARR